MVEAVFCVYIRIHMGESKCAHTGSDTCSILGKNRTASFKRRKSSIVYTTLTT